MAQYNPSVGLSFRSLLSDISTKSRELAVLKRSNDDASQDALSIKRLICQTVTEIQAILERDINSALLSPGGTTATEIWPCMFRCQQLPLLAYILNHIQELCEPVREQIGMIDGRGIDPLVALCESPEEIKAPMALVARQFCDAGLVGLGASDYRAYGPNPLHRLVEDYRISNEVFNILVGWSGMVEMVDSPRQSDMHTPLSLLACAPATTVRYHRLWRLLMIIDGRSCPNTVQKLQSMQFDNTPVFQAKFRRTVADYYRLHQNINGFMAVRQQAQEFWMDHYSQWVSKSYLAPVVGLSYLGMDNVRYSMPSDPVTPDGYCFKNHFSDHRPDSISTLSLGFCVPGAAKTLPMKAIFIAINENTAITINLLNIVISRLAARGEFDALSHYVNLRMQQAEATLQPTDAGCSSEFSQAVREAAQWSLASDTKTYGTAPTLEELVCTTHVMINTDNTSLGVTYHAWEVAVGEPHQTLCVELDVYHMKEQMNTDRLEYLAKRGITYCYAPGSEITDYSASSSSEPPCTIKPVESMSEAD